VLSANWLWQVGARRVHPRSDPVALERLKKEAAQEEAGGYQHRRRPAV
jgi:hypothetical protein